MVRYPCQFKEVLHTVAFMRSLGTRDLHLLVMIAIIIVPPLSRLVSSLLSMVTLVIRRMLHGTRGDLRCARRSS